MALFDFAGSINLPDDNTEKANKENTDIIDDKESDSIAVIDDDNKMENLQHENESKSDSEEEKDNKDIISDSTDTANLIDNDEPLNEIKQTITPDKTEKIISISATAKLEDTAITSVKISGVVFFDDELDSIYHKYSLGINNIVLKLYGENNKMIAKTVTRNFMHNSGYFEFDNVKPGKYKITISSPEDMFISPQNLRKYYGSKALRYKKAVIVDIGSNDVSNVFIGLYK